MFFLNLKPSAAHEGILQTLAPTRSEGETQTSIRNHWLIFLGSFSVKSSVWVFSFFLYYWEDCVKVCEDAGDFFIFILRGDFSFQSRVTMVATSS